MIRVGDVEVMSLLDGVQPLDDPIADSFPAVPADAWPAVNASFPELVADGGCWRLYVRCTLLRTTARAILVDTGVGRALSPAWFGADGRLGQELAAAGVSVSDVDTVVITHVHDDHIGGTVTVSGEPAFPNARYLIQRADLEWQRAWAGKQEEDRVIFETLLRPLEDAEVLRLLDGEETVVEGIRLRPAPGHTPGHQIVEVGTPDDRVLITGDAFNHPAQLANPGWYGRSDDELEVANATRRSLLEEVTDSPAVLAPSHFARPFGRVVSTGPGHVTWEPI